MWTTRRNFTAGLGAAFSAAPGRSATFFDGVDEASAAVMERARQRIEKIRKGDFRILVLDRAGKPVTGELALRLARHDFKFGASLFGFPRLPQAAREQALGVVDELFNTVTITNYWPENERSPGAERNWRDADAMLEWALRHGKTPRFHAMLFTMPNWAPQVTSREEWWRIIEARIQAVSERYGTRIHEYDVLNEVAMRAWIFPPKDDPMLNSKVFPAFIETENGVRCFQLARKYLPDAELVNNDTTILTPSSKGLPLVFKYSRELLAHGAPIDVIGHQAHFYASGMMPFSEGHALSGKGAFTMAMLEGGLDRLAELGKPVHITEFSAPSRNNQRKDPQPRLSDEEVAAWQNNYYTLAFSKPYIRQITRWFVI
ncbi:MAG: endo-1,4-beta-xylanase, partial [Bryobacteraceae bacterium]